MTVRLHKATLRHYMAPPEQSWHSQVSKGTWEVTLSCNSELTWASWWGEETSVKNMGWTRADLGQSS